MTTSSRRRVGFTLVELLVVITIIGMLVALLLPAVNAARKRALMLQCMNNMQNIGKAMLNYASAKGNLPGYVQPVQRQDKKYVQVTGSLADSKYSSTTGTTTTDREKSLISWAARILPQLDNEAMWDRLVDPNTPADDEVQPLAVLICPDDPDATSSPDNAALSYAANAGAWDRNEMGNYVGDYVENGLFHNLTFGKTTSRLESAKDSSSTTLMIVENIQKNSSYSWLGVAPTEFGEQEFGVVWVAKQTPYDWGGPAPTTVYHQTPFNQEAADFRPDKPWYARPAANHPAGVFNVVFADGSGRNLAPEIDYDVYQRLLTPNGRKCVDPLNPNADPPSADIQYFRSLAPLSDANLNQ
jgi:prepilin-type N-terminal cleavage/methylation domain-containing protein